MRSPIPFSLGLATAFASLSTGHTIFTTLFINDINQGDGTCIRMPKDGNVCTHPIAGGLNSPDMACGRDGQQAVAFTCPAEAGSKLTLEFRMWADASQPGAIDPSHLGSTAIYLKPVSNIATDSASGPGWFKIFHEGYDTTTSQWSTQKLIANRGLLSIDLPSALPTGYYLFRSEILTLQNVTHDTIVDPQFYVGCAQLFISGTSSSPSPSPCQPRLHPRPHLPTDPGLHFNVYKDDPVANSYHVVGPDPFFSTSSTKANTKTTTTQPQEEGLVPPTCLLKNANWCASELPAYNTEAGCWAASEDCYNQLNACYESAPPTGSRGCKVWEEEKCTVVQEECKSGVGRRGSARKGVKVGFEESASGEGGGAVVATPSVTVTAAAATSTAAAVIVAAPTETVKKSCQRKRMAIRERRRRN
ncbi:hypothetical protein N0V88_003307 [Collariella sp. IMI 366227]|nr:hypothetical protein N0V88_003307 [Collariella sp. IMI 366227]